ncbi:putative benzoate 4-monooxygenase cytochrome protein [Phaeoacremonium minimum UCRPA7]|uniref:Putative benzoate 4-monooxygenase cytochrome protein n=1 Tax=Phaeoacremonium minimum (strain UCR-PA7) TaxID=1286976 RepID=R8BS48_PHAM7|nr:putative benzoate 4-monooxygenase cytochrome protein [Phaeoacremonium minimum UCRPA7]EOO02154.1 putative benzoate 4-monooxygenase cytochrome protein [Phaeoacremonium minimum UCRPA7]
MAADPSTKPTLFSKLFKAGEEGLSDEEIIADAQAYIIAGSDTTAVTLTYLIWAVCRHREVKRNLLAELATLPHDFNADDLSELPYLNQVIDETLRVYGALPAGLPRIVPPGGANLAGYWVPGGTTVTAQAYTMHRNPLVYPRPETFDPSRWATATKAMKDSLMPFGLGSRSTLPSSVLSRRNEAVDYKS